MTADFQLWGTFSVADHKRRHAFIADVLVFDRLIVPVPAGDDDERWARNEWDVELQGRILATLRDGDRDRVVEVPWDGPKRAQFKERTAELAAAAGFDMTNIQAAARDDPDTPAQHVTRLVVRDEVNAQRDAQIFRGAMRGLPPDGVEVVAAYPSRSLFAEETGAEEVESRPATGLDLLAGFAWPFLVPAEEGRSELDLLKRAVEFANQPEVSRYRQAYHQWRTEIVRGLKTPQEAAGQLADQIAAYGEWSRRTQVRTRTTTACAVVGVGAGLLAAIAFPIVGVPALAESLVGAGSAGAGLVEFISTHRFRRSAKSPPMSGALFWEARKGLS